MQEKLGSVGSSMHANRQRHPAMDHPQRPQDGNVPIAWRHRELTLNNPYTRRASSPSITSSSSDDREEVPIVRHHYRPLSRHDPPENYRPLSRHDPPDSYRPLSRHDPPENYRPLSRHDPPDSYRPLSRHDPPDNYRPLSRHDLPPDNYRSLSRYDAADNYATIRNERSSRMDFPYRNSGTLRSTRSVPSLAFAMDDPCPVHGGRRHGSLFDIRSPPVGGPLSLAGLDKKSFYGSKHSTLNGYPPFHPPQYLPPPPPQMMVRPPQHQLLMEPILMRDHLNKSMARGYPTKEPVDPYRVEQVCCKGHLIVLWIILGVVTVGVILGIIMGVTIT